TTDVPESAVRLVPRDRASAAQVGVELLLVAAELVGVVIEYDDRVGTDVGTAHYAIFTSLGRLSHRRLGSGSDHRRTGNPGTAGSSADAQGTFRALTASAGGTGCRRAGPARIQFRGLCHRCDRARPGWRPGGAVSPRGCCGERRYGTAPLHPLRRRGSCGPSRRSPPRAAVS